MEILVTLSTMTYVVSITSQGQMTIPKAVRDHFGLVGAVKAEVRLDGDEMIVKPKTDFWALEGIAKTPVKLSDQELKQARSKFEKSWADKV